MRRMFSSTLLLLVPLVALHVQHHVAGAGVDLLEARVQYSQGFNCGGDQTLVMEDGTIYETDRVYSASNRAGRIGGRKIPNNNDDPFDMGGILEAVQSRALLKSRAEGWREYRFDVPTGTYMVTLHFMESVFHWQGMRAFSVAIEDRVEIESLDIFAEVDRRYAMLFRRVVQVDDGSLNIRSIPNINLTMINGVHTELIHPDTVAPPAPRDFSVIPAYGEAFIYWTAEIEPDEAGALLWRQDLTGGGEPELVTPQPVIAARYIDDRVIPGNEYRYRAESVDAWGNVSPPTPDVDVTILHQEQLPLRVCAFEMTQEDLIRLNSDRWSDVYHPALVRMDGDTWEDAKLRYRGNTTRDMVKKNYKIRFPDDRPLPENRVKLNLQSEWRVESPLREKLGYDHFLMTGAFAPEVGYMRLVRNDRCIGVYLDIEQVDEYFLENRGFSGTVWRAGGGDAWGDLRKRTPFSAYYDAYSLEAGQYSDYEYLVELIGIINDASDEDFRTAIRERLNIESFFDWYACQTIIGNWDHVVHNYFLFRDSVDGRFYFLPWDLELSWKFVDLAIDHGTRWNPYMEEFWNRLFDRLLVTPSYRRIYAVRLAELLDYPFSVEAVTAMIEDEHSWLRPEILRDPYPSGWDTAYYDGDLEYLLDFTVERHANMLAQLEEVDTDPTVNLFLNETVLRNVEGAVDEEGEHEPWVELYNFGIETIRLDGLGLSDEKADPFKWIFPGGVSIGPGGYLVVWLDGEEEEGLLHASFRAGPETPGLWLAKEPSDSIDALRIETVVLPDVPVARSPDSGALVHQAAWATPGSPNDSAPIVGLDLDIREEYLPGDTLIVAATITNHREFSLTSDLDLVIIANQNRIPICSIPLHLEPWATRLETIVRMIPDTCRIGRFSLNGSLRLDPGGDLLDEVRRDLRIHDPRPIPLVINEIMAANDSTIADEADQFDDWIEIYNPGSYSVHLGGLYLSDDRDTPTKWAIPELSIKPREYAIFWCDDDMGQGPRHTSFKLKSSGEEIGIYDLDIRGNAPVDRVEFGALSADTAYGRSPDGSDNLVLLAYPTPGSPNPNFHYSTVPFAE